MSYCCKLKKKYFCKSTMIKRLKFTLTILMRWNLIKVKCENCLFLLTNKRPTYKQKYEKWKARLPIFCTHNSVFVLKLSIRREFDFLNDLCFYVRFPYRSSLVNLLAATEHTSCFIKITLLRNGRSTIIVLRQYDENVHRALYLWTVRSRII